jgi:hypothetical protein
MLSLVLQHIMLVVEVALVMVHRVVLAAQEDLVGEELVHHHQEQVVVKMVVQQTIALVVVEAAQRVHLERAEQLLAALVVPASSSSDGHNYIKSKEYARYNQSWYEQNSKQCCDSKHNRYWCCHK